MTKRSFAVSNSSLATTIPLLNKGVYAGVIFGAAAAGKEGKQYFNIAKERGRWDKLKVNEEKGTVGNWEYPLNAAGENIYVLEGTIYFGVTLISKKAIVTLQQDEPKIFGGQIKIGFDQEGFCLGEKNNIVYKALLAATGLDDVEFSESVDFEYDEEIEVPEEFANVPNIVDMLNSLAYHRSLFALVTEALNGVPVAASILRQPKHNDKTTEENIIATGKFNSFCGVTAYEEGMEEDLED